jgi:Tol biopolymer transport system component
MVRRRELWEGWMRRMVVAVLALVALAGPAVAAAPAVREHGGDIAYRDAAGAERVLTQGGGYGEPALSPDGKSVAFIHTDGPSPGVGEGGPTTLWIADVASGQRRVLFASRPEGEEVKFNMTSFGGPVFSLDGGYVYVSAVAWATSSAVHQVNVATGAERFVIDGGLSSVIRTGPYRGDLLVSRHIYYPGPQGGSYDPTFVVRPDGKALFAIPHSEDDGVVAKWLAKKGWKAW